MNEQNLDKNQKINQSKGEGEQAQKGGTHKLGDMLEKLGDKIEHSGMPGASKLGDAIEKLGDKVEHMTDKGENKSDAA